MDEDLSTAIESDLLLSTLPATEELDIAIEDFCVFCEALGVFIGFFTAEEVRVVAFAAVLDWDDTSLDSPSICAGVILVTSDLLSFMRSVILLLFSGTPATDEAAGLDMTVTLPPVAVSGFATSSQTTSGEWFATSGEWFATSSQTTSGEWFATSSQTTSGEWFVTSS